jgi:urea transport system permease protein
LRTFIDILSQGLGVGAIYLLGALGLTIIYGVMGVINLAHGEFIMLGSYVVALLASDLSSWGAIVLAPLIVGAIGYLVDVLLIRFMYHKPVASMLGTWGLGMVLRQTVTLLFGADLRYVALPLAGSFSIGYGSTFSEWRALLIGCAALTAALVGFVIRKTNFGLKMRAVIGNPETSQALGLRVAHVNRWAFTLGCALAGLAGALVAPLLTVFPGMGTPYLVGAFLVVILSGLGNVRATVFWSIAIGLGSAAVAIEVDDIIAQIAIWGAALIIIALRSRTVAVLRV